VYNIRVCGDRGDPRGSGGADRSEAINRYTRRRRPGARALVCVSVCVQARRGLGGARVTAFAFFRQAVRARCVYRSPVCMR